MYVREVSLCLIKILVHFCSMIFAIPNLNWFDIRCGRYMTMTIYKKLRKKMKPWKLIWTTRSLEVFCYSFLVYFQAINMGLDLYLSFFFSLAISSRTWILLLFAGKTYCIPICWKTDPKKRFDCQVYVSLFLSRHKKIVVERYQISSCYFARGNLTPCSEFQSFKELNSLYF